MKVSVVIPTYNKLPRLKLTLASFTAQTYSNKDFEVIVVDDGSSDGTCEFLQSFKADFSLRYVPQQNKGRAAARNTGICMAEGDIVIFTDDDLIVHPRFIEEHINCHKDGLKIVHGRIVNLTYLKFFSDPTNGVFYPYLNVRDESTSYLKSKCISEKDVTERFAEVIWPNNKMTDFELAVKSILENNIHGYEWISFTGGNVSTPRHLLQSVNAFDETFGLKWGCEDFELGYRLYEKGYPFIYADNAVNYHMVHYRENHKEELADTIEYFYKMHPDSNILVLKEFLLENISRNDFITRLKID